MWCRVLFLFTLVFVTGTVHNDLRQGIQEWKLFRDNHAGAGVTDDQLRTIAAMEDYAQFERVLDPILVPRVPDTAGHAAVRRHITGSLRSLGWQVEEDSFQANTPRVSDVTFTNIIATADPAAPRRLILACHYDSLQTRSGRFVGATDSAVPCAQLINMAHVLKRQLDKHKTERNDVTLQFMFFDGEEAFVRWTSRDSIYGARHLAHKLDQSPYLDTGASGVSDLDRMDVLVLLDLIGASNPTFYSYFPESEGWYLRLVSFEERLRSMGLYRGLPRMFRKQQWHDAKIQDDHLPFHKRGVPILHLISYPFPPVWHKDSDNKANIDKPTISNMNTVLRAFVVDYLHLAL